MKKKIGVVLSLLLVCCFLMGGWSLGEVRSVEASEFQASGIIWIAGDSMAADHSATADQYKVPLCGWGVPFGDYFTKDVTVRNMAIGGRSSKSFLEDANYATIMENIGKGDYLFVQFGHNDTKSDRWTDPYGASDEEGSFKYYIKNYYIEPALKAGAKPVIMSSVVKYQFNGNVLRGDQTHRPYAVAMRELAEEYKTAGIEIGFIDMYDVTETLYNTLGPAEAVKYHGVELDGSENSTHYCADGAAKIADIIVKNLYLLNTDINQFIVQKPVEGGTGSKENPYLINNTMQLFATMDAEQNNENAYYKLTDDLMPIIQKQEKERSFYGHLDGDGHTLFNIVAFGKDAFFHNNYGEISDCNIQYQLSEQKTQQAQSLFVKNNYGTIQGCTLRGNLVMDYETEACENEYVYGGIVSYNMQGAVVTDCAVSMNVSIRTNSSKVIAGGVVGENKGSIVNCSNSGRIGASINSDQLVESSECIVGGIVGVEGEESTMRNCIADEEKITASTSGVCYEKIVKKDALSGGKRAELDQYVETMVNQVRAEELPELVGVYGTRIMDMELTGGAVKAGNYLVSGKWTFADDEIKRTDIPVVKTKNKYKFVFQPDDETHFQRLEKELYVDVTPKTITITIDSFWRLLGESNPELTYTLEDGVLVEGDTKETLNIKLSTKAVKESEAGAYKITGKAKNANYDIKFKTGYIKVLLSKPGDVNRDNRIDLTDVYQVLQVALKITESNDEFVLNADTNGNERIDMEDVQQLLLSVLKLS